LIICQIFRFTIGVRQPCVVNLRTHLRPFVNSTPAGLLYSKQIFLKVIQYFERLQLEVPLKHVVMMVAKSLVIFSVQAVNIY